MAALKGGARYFEKKKIFENIDKLTKDEDSTWELIEDIVEDKDATGMRYAKTILWLQMTGRAKDMAPPTRQLKTFLNNDVGPYYSYYEDDEYFIDRAELMRKDFKADLVDIYRAIYFYRTMKMVLPRGAKFKPKKMLAFMKKEKLNAKKMTDMLSDIEKRDKLAGKILKFMGYSNS